MVLLQIGSRELHSWSSFLVFIRFGLSLSFTVDPGSMKGDKREEGNKRKIRETRKDKEDGP